MIQAHQHASPSPHKRKARPRLGTRFSPTNRPRRGKLSVRHDGSSVSGWLRRTGRVRHRPRQPRGERDDRESARRSQADTDIFSAASRSKKLTHLLLTKCGADFEPIVYSSSGSEAAESAMK